MEDLFFVYSCFTITPLLEENIIRNISNVKYDLQWLQSKVISNKLAICCKRRKYCRLTANDSIEGMIQNKLGSQFIVEKVVSDLDCPFPILLKHKEEFIFQREMINDSHYLEEMKLFFKEYGVFIMEDYFRVEISPQRIEKMYNEVLSIIEIIELKYGTTLSFSYFNYLSFRLAKLQIDIHKVEQFKEVGFRGDFRYDIILGDECEEIKKFGLNSFWIPFINQFLPYWTLDISVVYTRKGAKNQRWHSDGEHISDTVYGICVFLPLVNLNNEIGFTQFWPGSHSDSLLCDGRLAEKSILLNSQLDAIVNVGNCVFYDYRLMHRGMQNMTENESSLRPILQFFYHLPTYVEKKNYGTKSIFAS
jgi:hypothetical protein